MPAKKPAKNCRETCLETLNGLRTLVEMQQVLIAQAIEQLGDAKSESAANRKNQSA